MTHSMRAPHLLAAMALLTVAAGCVPASDAPTTPAPWPAPAPSTDPGPPRPPPAAPPVRADFLLRGTPEQGAVMLGQAPGGTRTLTLDGQPVPLARDESFLIAFDRDAGPSARLVATLASGQRVERTLTVAAGSWRIEHINAPYRGSASSDAEFARRRPAELAQIAAARATGALMIVDSKARSFARYGEVDIVKPNAAELAHATDMPTSTDAEVAEIEQLYLIGLHLEQYRHPTLAPEIYWQEALRRDPGESRVNLVLGKGLLRREARRSRPPTPAWRAPRLFSARKGRCPGFGTMCATCVWWRGRLVCKARRRGDLRLWRDLKDCARPSCCAPST